MQIMSFVGIIFLAVAAAFLAVAIRDKEERWRKVGRVRLRLALIFAIVGIGLNLLHTFLR
jgi:apolipoprotein N-acyltransferase